MDHLVGGGLRGLAFFDEGADFAGEGEADEVLADTGAGDGASVVVGVGAGADERRIADAAGEFGLHATGGGGGGEVAFGVAGDGADGAEAVGEGLR